MFPSAKGNKVSTEFRGFDDKILSMYALGLATRQIQDRLKEIYAVDVSPELVSRVTDEVKELAAEWRGRALEPFYPALFLDALRVDVRDGATAVKKSVCLALAIRLDGQKELLGLWIEQNEGAKFWMGVMNELKSREEPFVAAAKTPKASGTVGMKSCRFSSFPLKYGKRCIRPTR